MAELKVLPTLFLPILTETYQILGILDIDSTEYSEETDSVMIEGSNVTFRATYLIDETGKIFHESVNDMPLGRNVNEYYAWLMPILIFKKRRSLSCKLGKQVKKQ
jgi:alkyl hydroperoxide reductase subunit AhpC